ncbi:MAG: SDR family oxidoreductase [Deltaproteobacteria bacterium]|nr:SDR family oxidoreductase [Deltaproteobacteria bacterium]
MDLGLKNKVALVAGGSMGLGLAVAKRLAHEGAKIAICALDDPHLALAKEEIFRETGAEVFAFGANLSDPVAARDFVSSANRHFGTVDILVNNAGGPPSLQFLEISDEQWLEGFHLNLLSTIAMTAVAVPVMKEKKWGRIVNITSISVKQPIEGLILSNTIRSGVIGFSKTLSNELAPLNVTINSVCPGYTLTERVRKLSVILAEKRQTTPEAVIAGWENDIPMKRLGTPEEFAALVAFLASELAAYITGAAIQIDGGWYKGVM